MTFKVLILGARAPVALDHARRFSYHRWQVHVADSVACRLTAASKTVTRRHAIAPARYDPRGYVADLNRIVTEQRIDLLLPTCEEALYLARHRSSLPSNLCVAVDGFDKLLALHSKWGFTKLATTHGMRVPASARVDSLDQAREWAQGRAVVLKPEFSRFGVHVRLYPDGIPANAPALAPLGAWVVQALVSGEEVCSYAIAHQGRLLAHAVYRPRYRLGRSSSYYFEPVQAPDIAQATARLVQGMGYTGQISFDWIVGANGKATALECNPRATSGLHLFPMAAKLPDALLGDGSLCEPGPVRPKMMAPLMLGPGLRAAQRSGALRRWRQDWQRADDVICVPGDRMPVIGALSDIGAYARLAVAKRCSLREAATRDIEWDGEPCSPPAA